MKSLGGGFSLRLTSPLKRLDPAPAPGRRCGTVNTLRADPAAASALSALARAAKAHWGYPTSWLEQWRDQLTITPEFIAAEETYAAEVEGRIVGFHALVAADQSMRLEHLWVLPQWMGQGIGRFLFEHAAARAAARGATCLTIEADPHAEAFYLRMGAVRVATIPSEIDGVPRELPVLTFALTNVA